MTCLTVNVTADKPKRSGSQANKTDTPATIKKLRLTYIQQRHFQFLQMMTSCIRMPPRCQNEFRSPPCLRIFSALLGLVITLQSAKAQVEPTQLFSLSRTGGQAGTSFDVKVQTGTNLTEIESLFFSDERITAELKTTGPRPFTDQPVPLHGQFTVTVPPDVGTGRFDVRAKGRNGLSNPRAFLVSQLTNEAPASISHDESSPTPLLLNTLLHADATSQAVDYFSVKLEKPSLIQIEILAQRLDSRLIPLCKLLDASGHQIGSVRGADGVDTLLETEETLSAGEYLISVNDFLYRGGDEYHYQIVARPSDQPALLESAPTEQGQLPTNWSIKSTSVGAATVKISEESPNDQPASLALPHLAKHSYSDDASASSFQIKAEKNQQISIEVTSERLGEPADARLVVERLEPQATGAPKRHSVASADDSQSISDGVMNFFSTDPTTIFNAPETAEYLVSIRDLDIGKSLRKKKDFFLRMGNPSPDFQLIAYRPFPHSDLKQSQPVGSRLFRGSKEIIRVFVIRRDGWSGPVQLRCEGLPPGVVAPEITLAANQSFAQLVLSAASDAPEGVSQVKIVGRNSDGSIEHEAAAATIQWAKGAGRDFIQTRQTPALWVSVSARDTSPLTAEFGDGNVVEVKKGEAIKVPVKLVRQDGGKAACVARARHFPKGIKAADLTIPAENNEGECEIKTDGTTTPGTYSLWLQVETKIKFKPNPQALQTAQDYRNHLQKLHDDPNQAEKLDAIKAAITEADKLVEAAKSSANEKEVTVFLPTSNTTLRVVEP